MAPTYREDDPSERAAWHHFAETVRSCLTGMSGPAWTRTLPDQARRLMEQYPLGDPPVLAVYDVTVTLRVEASSETAAAEVVRASGYEPRAIAPRRAGS